MASKHVRLKRLDPRHGIVLKQYWYKGIKFLESEGWYVVSEEVAAYLERHARQRANDPQSPTAFEIVSAVQARNIDEREALEKMPRRPAEKARVTQARGEESKRTRKRSPKPAATPAPAPADKQPEETKE